MCYWLKRFSRISWPKMIKFVSTQTRRYGESGKVIYADSIFQRDPLKSLSLITVETLWGVSSDKDFTEDWTEEIKPVNPKGNQSWIIIGRINAEAEAPVLWPPDGKKWLIWKDPDAGKDWRQEEKGTTEDEMVGWHHWLYGHEFEQAPGLVMAREAWGAAIHGVPKSQTPLSNWTELDLLPAPLSTFQSSSLLPEVGRVIIFYRVAVYRVNELVRDWVGTKPGTVWL